MAVETRWWHTEGGKVVCTLCPRECHIPEGSRGFCFVRANVDGALELTTDGRSSGFCIDPIEKKPLNHFLPGTPIMSFGTAGCNLGCKFCQNWDISKSREMDRLADEATPEAIIEAAEQTGCRSVAFTYNDPVIWAEYAIEISKIARQRDIRTVAVTAGYISPDARREFYKWIDAANMDLKAFTETFYRGLTQTHLEPVLDTLKYLKHETDVWFEITNLMIPGENDSPDETRRMCAWIVEELGPDVPVHFTAFHPDFKMRDKPRTPHETLIRARQIAQEAGIAYVYVGNVNDLERQSTYCGHCGQMVIERDWYDLGRYELDGARCRGCGREVPGVFESQPGDWGRKRTPVTIRKTSEDRVTVSARGPRRQAAAATGVTAVAATAPASVGASSGRKVAERGPTFSEPAVPPRIEFDDDEAARLLVFTRQVVDAAVTGGEAPGDLPAGLHDSSAYGIFVTLRRGEMLRACRGRWGGDEGAKLGEMLRQVAVDTAASDQRFPSIAGQELTRLALDISLMHSPRVVEATGEDRIDEITVGTHGLVIHHQRGRGLLLPHVATEAGWDSKTFLDSVCRKAGLPPDTWRRDSSARIMTFQSRLLTDPAPRRELDRKSINGHDLQELTDWSSALLRGQSPSPPNSVLADKHDEQLGLWMQTTSDTSTAAIGTGQSLVELARAAVGSLTQLNEQKGHAPSPIRQIVALWQAIRLDARDYPGRHRGMGRHAVLARNGKQWSLIVNAGPGQRDRITSALANLGLGPEQWRRSDDVQVTAFTPIAFEARRPPQRVRPPARAGQFYPGDPSEMGRALDEYLPGDRGGARCRRAVMLPHAGWVYCGQTMGRALAATEVPDTLVIIGPNHTGQGPAWSIASHTSWDLPGASIPIATDLADELAERVDGLVHDDVAHRMEHGTEVLLPFLHRINPSIRVVPIVIGRCQYEQTTAMATALAEVCGELGQPPLLVISSDMNHFAAEPENRRLDHMALDAMATGDPRRLYETCTVNQISMCGMVPACIIMQALAMSGDTPKPELIDYSNSAAASGDTSRVVGYAGVVMD
ncbi:MAG: hypothetical protein CMJ18_23195 [Phycisphaeraceae bacterium]|nr:hypothetical protein [Phycisphaeraceae bacterium]